MNGNKIKYTPTEAIAAVDGLHRKRLYEMMTSGDITYEIASNGSRNKRLIDAAELIRVFGDAFRVSKMSEMFYENTEKQYETQDRLSETARLQLEIQLLKERLEAKNLLLEEKLRTIEDLREDRNEWRKQAQILLLPEGRPQPQRSLWSRLFGRDM
jgi:hypothetical protein